MRLKRDVFISYKSEEKGNSFASTLSSDLKAIGYGVYFNPDEQHSGEFPDRLRQAVEECTDFILILTHACLEQLLRHDKIDWVREELLLAYRCNKNIIPLVMPGVSMPKDKEEMPEDLQFLPDKDWIKIHDADKYHTAPFNELITLWMKSKPETELYKNVSNENPLYDIHKDFLDVLARAESGNIEAMYEVGCMYFYGFASKDNSDAVINYAEAGKWLNKVSVSGHELSPKADLLIGQLYYAGLMPYEEQSFEKCTEYYEKSGSEIPQAYYERVGFMKSESVGSYFNMDEILGFFDSCEKDCSNTTKNNMAKFYINYGMFDKAIRVLESIKESYPDAEYKLGILYQRGLHRNPPMPDIYRAEHHFQKAAESNHLDAIHALGLLNFRAVNGYKKDFIKARDYYRIAAEKGHRGAQYDYAWMCKNGLGGCKDIVTAIDFFEKSALKGHLLSMRELATLYQLEECRNYQKACEWADKGASFGDPMCEFVLGNLYLFGRGCKADMSKAMIFYKRAQKNGICQAEIMMEKIKSICTEG